MTLDARLLEILACPEDKGPLWYIEDEDLLVNPRLTRGYRIDDGIPVMLIDEALALEATEMNRIEALVAERGIGLTFDPGAVGEA